MEHIDHDHLSTQVIQIPSKSKTSLSREDNQLSGRRLVLGAEHRVV